MKKEKLPVVKKNIYKVNNGRAIFIQDDIAVEAPLEIKLIIREKASKEIVPLAITMRTPCNDKQLTLGYLFSEGIIGKHTDIEKWEQLGNTIHIELQPTVASIDLKQYSRSTIMHASCGICGKPSLDSIEKISCYYPLAKLPKISASLIGQLPELLLKKQTNFIQTGGMHAAALFQTDGQLLSFQEDIGRHNALDKLIGWAMQQELIPLRQQVLFLSGRISFELVQKASLAGIPIIAAVGAPSTLAIELAEANDITLIGFVKKDRFNIYYGEERLSGL